MHRGIVIAAIVAGAAALVAGCGGGSGSDATAADADPCVQAVRTFVAARDTGTAAVDEAADSLAVCPGRDEWSAGYRAVASEDMSATDERVIAALMSACETADPDRLTTTCAGLGPG